MVRFKGQMYTEEFNKAVFKAVNIEINRINSKINNIEKYINSIYERITILENKEINKKFIFKEGKNKI